MILRIILILTLLLSPVAVIALSISEDENSLQITSLMSAVIDDDVQSVDFFSKSDNEKINEKNIGGASALALACRKDNAEIVKILLNSGAIANNVDNEGWTPLMRAANNGNYEIVDLLLIAKADVTKVNSQKEGALVHAAKSGCIKCFTAIFAKFDLTHFITTELLKSQLNSSFAAAKKQGNIELQSIITAQLGLIVDEKTQDSKLDQDFKIIDNNFAVEEVGQNNKKSFKKSKKKFSFKVDEGKKFSVKEAEAERQVVAQEKQFISRKAEQKVSSVKESPEAVKAVKEDGKVKKFTFRSGQEKLEKSVGIPPEKAIEIPSEKIVKTPTPEKVIKEDNYLESIQNTGKKFILNKVQ